MQNKALVFLWCALTTIACGKSAPGGGKAIDPASGYAKLRPGIVKGASEFPSDPSTLARCSPGLTNVVMLTLPEASRALNTPAAKPTAGFGAALRTHFGEHLAALEGGAVDDLHLSWFENAAHVALFDAVVATAPTMTNCEREPNTDPRYATQSTCTLTPGIVGGNVVVFDPAGRPTCAVKLRIDGPLVVAGSRGVEAETTSFVGQVLTRLFDKRKPTDPPATQFLTKLSREFSYKVTVDDAVVIEPPPR